MSNWIARTDQSILGRWWWTVDRWLLGTVVLLVIFGLILIAAASPAVAERYGYSSFYFVKRHLIYLGPSLVFMFGISMLSLKNLRRLASLAFIGSLILVLLTILIGPEINGAQRWLYIAGYSLQPSEFLKPSFAIVTAWLFASKHKDDRFPGYKISIIFYFLIASLLMLQPDLGMTVVISGIWAAQFFMAGLPLSIILGLIILASVGMVWIYFSFPHVSSRIDRFLDPSSGDTYQIERSLDSFKSGGLFGTGPGQGEVKLILPDAHTDFIFSVSGEELGLIMTLLLVSLFAFVIIRGFIRIRHCEDVFIILATGGLLVQFGSQALIHMGSSLKLLPAKGMTLPFVSYGGSSLLALGFTFGMILALTRRHQNTGGKP